MEGITAFEGSNFGDALDEDIYNSADWVTTSTPYSGAKRKRNCAWIDFTDFEASSREEFIAKLNGQGFDSSCCYCDLYAGIKFVSNVTKDARTSQMVSLMIIISFHFRLLFPILLILKNKYE